MADFWSGFNQGFQPYGTRAADLISRTILNNSARDKDFYNQIALQNNRGKNALDLQRQKLLEEQAKIKAEKEANLKQQEIYESILANPEANQGRVKELNDKFQIKLNRSLELQRELGDMNQPDEVVNTDFVKTEDVEGLNLKGKYIQRTRKIRGDQTTSTTYGKVLDPEDFNRDPNKEPNLSKAEKQILTDIDKNFKSFADDLSVIQTYGVITKGSGKDQETMTKDEYVKYMNRYIAKDTELIKTQLKKQGSLGLYNEIYNKYRSEKDLNQMNPLEKLDYFENYIEEVENAYKDGKIDSADLKLYEYLFTLDSKKNMSQFKAELAQAKQLNGVR